MGLKIAVSALVEGRYLGSNDLSPQAQDFAKRIRQVFLTGGGADQANFVFADTRTLAASATENLDLAGGLTDAFGQALTFASIKAILVKAAAGNTNNVVIGGAASNAFLLFGDATDTLAIPPDGFALIVAPGAAGFPVAAGTGDILKMANSGGSTSVEYEIILLGD
jgi:hypothetical protein